MKKEFELSHNGRTFRFVVEQHKAGNGILLPEIEGYDSGAPFIACRLYRTDMPDFDWIWEGYLLAGPKIEFRLVYDDRIDIRGYITLFHSDLSGENFVFMDAYYGRGYEEHFEGNILEIGHDGPWPPHPHPDPDPEPHPEPEPDPTPHVPDGWVDAGGFRDLFPYLYLQYWPELKQADQIFGVAYPADMASSSVFYGQLKAALGTSQARTAIENEALGFINGSDGYAGEFIPTVYDLPFPLDLYPDLYDALYENRYDLERHPLLRLVENGEYNSGADYTASVSRVWDNLMALNIVEGYRAELGTQLGKVLIIDHLLAGLIASPPTHTDPAWLRGAILASVLLPEPVFPLPPYETAPQAGPGYTGCVVPYAVGDLQMVRHKPLGYERGEIARIENVLAGEMKKTRQRKTETVEDKQREESTRHTSEKSLNREDALEKQVMETLADSLTESYDFGDLKQSYGPPTTGTYSGTVSKSVNRNRSLQGPESFAKRILSQTVSKFNKEVSARREHTLRNETEESVSHTVDNRKGQKNIQGIYCWLNRVYEMQLVNYGHRFLLEFLVTKPVIAEADLTGNSGLMPPLPPGHLPEKIDSYQNITPENYLRIGEYYGIHILPLPPAGNKVLGVQVNGNEFPVSRSLAVPDGYLPESLTITYKTDTPGLVLAGLRQADLTVSETSVVIDDPLGLNVSPPLQVSPVDLTVPLLVDIESPVTSPPGIASFFVNATLYCNVSDQLLDYWKQQVFELITKGYRERLERFRAQLHRRSQTNPDLADHIARRLVKAACKKILGNIHLQKDGSPLGLSPPEDMVNKPAYTHFYDEAFEWDKMAYSLEQLPTGKDDLLRQMEEHAYEDRLERFLAAESLRVIVPVSETFHYRILYYLASGIVAYGEDHLVPVFEADLPLAVKLKKVFDLSPDPHRRKPETWIVKIPTEMQWLTAADKIRFVNPDPKA